LETGPPEEHKACGRTTCNRTTQRHGRSKDKWVAASERQAPLLGPAQNLVRETTMRLGRSLASSVLALGCLASASQPMLADSPETKPRAARVGREQLPQPVYRVAQQPANSLAANNLPAAPSDAAPPNPAEHPLVPALQMAYASLANIRNNVKDYQCTMIKHERISGKLADPEFMYLKVRHEPFSVYMYFLGPERIKGQEALYVAGKNNGNLLGHGVGIRKIAGTVPLLPTGAMAMQGQRYPITEIGFLNLTRRLVEVAELDKQYGECDVKFFRNAKINNGRGEKRSVTCIQVTHPVKRSNFRFNIARVYVDDELNIPVRYEAFDWPDTPGGQPLLLEEYTYTDIKVNNGFTDADFDEYNPKYHFH
jgi:hypothetical protein